MSLTKYLQISVVKTYELEYNISEEIRKAIFLKNFKNIMLNYIEEVKYLKFDFPSHMLYNVYVEQKRGYATQHYLNVV
jgi:hypothetical protein